MYLESPDSGEVLEVEIGSGGLCLLQLFVFQRRSSGLVASQEDDERDSPAKFRRKLGKPAAKISDPMEALE